MEAEEEEKWLLLSERVINTEWNRYKNHQQSAPIDSLALINKREVVRWINRRKRGGCISKSLRIS